MLGRRRPDAPSNEAVVAVPLFTPDPHGAAMFAGATNGAHFGGLSGTRPVIDARGPAWHGWTTPPQSFRGAGNLGAGRPVVPPGSRLDQQSGSLAPDPIQQIFEQRMAARRFS